MERVDNAAGPDRLRRQSSVFTRFIRVIRAYPRREGSILRQATATDQVQ